MLRRAVSILQGKRKHFTKMTSIAMDIHNRDLPPAKVFFIQYVEKFFRLIILTNLKLIYFISFDKKLNF